MASTGSSARTLGARGVVQRAARASQRVLPLRVRGAIARRTGLISIIKDDIRRLNADGDTTYFDALYRKAYDPYDFLGKPYEALKYDTTLAAAGTGPFDRALEIGCSIGIFTELLAPRCRELVAVDIAQAAIDRAHERLADARNVVLECRVLPDDMPDGTFDLIVCSDVLFYWDDAAIERLIPRLEAALRDDGRLVALHYTGETHEALNDARSVHDRLEAADSLVVEARTATDDYLLDVLVKRR